MYTDNTSVNEHYITFFRFEFITLEIYLETLFLQWNLEMSNEIHWMSQFEIEYTDNEYTYVSACNR
jgi:hypothetical protein